MAADQKPLQLMTTDGCHLCETALTQFERGRYRNKFAVELVDIIDDPALLERFQEKIPVFFDPVSHKELAWPFSIVELDTFLAGIDNNA